MDKPKRKAKQPNFLQYFLNEFILFRRDFSFVTQLSVEELILQLRSQEVLRYGCWPTRRIIVNIVDGDSTRSFEIKVEQYTRGYDQSAVARGIIHRDDNTTNIEGTITIGSWNIAFWILMWVIVGIASVGYSIYQGIGYFSICISLQPLLFILIPCFRMYRDRNYLLKIVENAVLPEKQKVKHKGKNHV